MIILEPPRGLPEGADSWRFLGLSRAGLTRFFRSAQRAIGLDGEVDILLTSDLHLRKLNHRFRGKNRSTDVLSFPAPFELSAVHAGDLAISVETAARQAREHGHTLREELRVLLLHGLLHLHGMDHESDNGQMASREAELRARLRLPAGLIARAASKPGGPPETGAARERRGTATSSKHAPSRSRKPTQARRSAARPA